MIYEQLRPMLEAQWKRIGPNLEPNFPRDMLANLFVTSLTVENLNETEDLPSYYAEVRGFRKYNEERRVATCERFLKQIEHKLLKRYIVTLPATIKSNLNMIDNMSCQLEFEVISDDIEGAKARFQKALTELARVTS